ncbi:MAG: phosphatidylserine decarboxylase [Nanoarchaeota archaeon]
MQLILTILFIFAAILSIILALWKFVFLRNPTPNIPKGGNLILSPANGNVARIYKFSNGKTEIAEIAEKGFFGKIPLITKDVAKEGYIVLIRLHVYNIHWQRAPIAGTIESTTYTKGKFLNAVNDVYNMQCFFENERNEIIIKGKITCKVIQIAGYLARRIECFVKRGDKVNTGDTIGLINLGSQTALIIPKIRLQVKEGDVLQVGETVIGEMK